MSADLKRSLQTKCSHLDIPLMGVASAESWEVAPFHPWVPPAFQPRSIWPEVNSVIVIGLPIDLPIIETTPSIYYHELYKTVNTLLDHTAYRLARFLDEKGFPSIYLPRDGYGSLSVLSSSPYAFFSHRHAAYLAGLGNFGVNNMLLTPQYGPRVRFTSIFTTAELPADKLMEERLCVRCMRCARSCPVRALDEEDYPQGLAHKEVCSKYNEQLYRRHISPCGVCIKVCPVGEDRKRFERTAPDLYENKEKYPTLHQAWRHVRSYGGVRKPNNSD